MADHDVQRLEEVANEPSNDVAADPVDKVHRDEVSSDEVKTVAATDHKAADEVSEVKAVTITTVTEKEDHLVMLTGAVEMIDTQVKLSTVGEERAEAMEGESRNNVQVIEFDYDDSQEEIELDLANFSGHTPHCPNCRHQITKVILRRKQKVPEPSVYDKVWGYCIKCVTVVRTTVTWHTILQVVTKMIDATHEIRGKGDRTDEDATITAINSSPNDINSQSEITEKTDKDESGKEEKDSTNTTITESPDTINPKKDSVNLPEKKTEEVKIDGGKGKPLVPRDDDDDDDDDEVVTVPDEEEIKQGSMVITINNTKLHEILKCVVYGGLIESITSLSVVASVAATDATTLNVLAIGLALLFSGLIAFCFNLVDLKNDAYSIKKYRELLGRKKDNFRLHATCAILSYVIFGLIAPTTYAVAFHESDNKEHKIIVAVIAAFACIFLLAMAKAYVTREKGKLPRYVETTRYYLIIALSVSGVAYAVGYMIEMLMLGLGLFRSAQRVTCYVPDQRISATPTWA